jgi:hypothetical protein
MLDLLGEVKSVCRDRTRGFGRSDADTEPRRRDRLVDAAHPGNEKHVLHYLVGDSKTRERHVAEVGSRMSTGFRLNLGATLPLLGVGGTVKVWCDRQPEILRASAALHA